MYLKKIILTLLLLICLTFFTGCYKKDTKDFVEGDYILENKENEASSFDNYKLNNVKLSFKEIDNETYESKEKQNVLENRYSKKYYAVVFSMIIDGIDYNDIKFTERPGSSNYNNRYYFYFLLTYNEKEYDCIFRFDIINYNWLYQVDKDQANSFRCSIFETMEKEGKKYNGKLMASFELNYTSNEVKTMYSLVTYDYGTIEENKITILIDSCLPFFNFSDYGIEQVYPGDQLIIEYTGQPLIEESYPGNMTGIEIKNVTLHDRIINTVLEEEIERDANGYIKSIASNQANIQYIILDNELNYILLNEYNGDKVYSIHYNYNKLGSSELTGSSVANSYLAFSLTN